MKKLLQLEPPITRSIRQQHQFTSEALQSFNISNEVLSVINTARPIEPALAKFVPFINRQVVISVLQSQSQLDPRLSFRFFIWASGSSCFRSGLTKNLIVDMLSKGGGGGEEEMFELYWSVLDELKEEEVPIFADAFVVLILGYWRLKKAEKAVDAFGRMREYGCKPNLAAYNVILNVLVKKDVILMALAVYNMMLKSNSELGADTLSVLIHGLCKSGMTQDALKLFDEMTTVKGIRPNKVTYTVILSGLCKAERMDDALRLFGLMKSSGCRPDSATYNALLDGFCKFGKIDEAFSLLKSFKDEGYKFGIRGFSSLIDGLVRAKRIGEAEELFQQVFEVGLIPDVVLYSTMMRGLCEAGRVEDAVNMFRDMIGEGVKPDTQSYNVLIQGCCEAGFLDQARSLKSEMISDYNLLPDTCTYSILIWGLCRQGLISEAQQLFSDMEKEGCFPSIVTFNALINGLCRAGKIEEAQLMLYKMEIGKNPSLFLRLSQGDTPVLDSESLQKMVESLLNLGLYLKAYKLLTQLADSGVVPDIKTYNTLINGMCKAGKVNGALKLFEELQLKGHAPNSITYATLIEGLQSAEREDDAFKLFEQMIENGCKPGPSVYKTLMTWSCRRIKTTVAFGLWLKYLRSLSGRDGEALKTIEQLFVKGAYEKAVKGLLEMETKLADFDSGMYNIWLVGLCQSNRVEEALRTFSILQEFGVIISAPSCVRLIQHLCSKGKLHEAAEVFLYTTRIGHRLRREPCNTLLQILLSSKDTAILAFELVDKMKSAGYHLNSHLFWSTKSLLHYEDPPSE